MGLAFNSNIPQILLIPDKDLLHANKNMLLWKQYALKHLPKHVFKEQRRILTYSTGSKERIERINSNGSSKKFLYFLTL